ncbi:hypothetical protein KKH13_04440 [Patescibacteria group bacterium]|nr:hypothetical protein [Patescibacteria group bacterium]
MSHLISNNPGQEPSTQPSAETLVVPPVNNSQGEPPYQSTTHKGIPRWLIGLGVGLLVLVGGTSAYFILGIGQPKTTTSVPAQVAPQTTEVNPPPPLPIPTAQPATGSANFGNL